MKKLFALLLVVLMLLPCLVACGNKPADSTDTSKETDTTTDTSKPSDTDTSKPSDTDTSKPSDTDTGSSSNDKISSQDTVLTKYKGKTLNVLGSYWNNANNAPWTLPELVCKGKDDETNFGLLINGGVVDRNELIKEKYGVTVNWIGTGSSAVKADISSSIAAGEAGTVYHLALPRAYSACDLITMEVLYDLLSSKYIDLSRSYYNADATQAHSAFGKSFFVGGDFSFLYKHTTSLIYLNKTMADKIEDFPDLYAMVKEGKWTIDELIKLAKGVVKDDGDGVWTNKDTYGAYLSYLPLFTAFGIKTVSSDGEHAMEITINDPKINTIINKILEINGSTWNRSEWKKEDGNNDWYAPVNAIIEGRLLFMYEVVEKYGTFAANSDKVTVGALPLPKLNEAQEGYATTSAIQTALMCIPRTTDDREFSEYMLDVLAWTGAKYVVSKYDQQLEAYLPDDDGATSEMLNDYIFPNVKYDLGLTCDWGWGKLAGVLRDCYTGGTNNFQKLYEESYDAALAQITSWNDAYEFYEE